jgi:hypothetical protein
MSLLGPWEPQTPEERLDRLDSLALITQLPPRYALALDSHDLDGMAALFVPDVRVGREQRGRPALKAWFEEIVKRHGASVHFVGNHIVAFDDADHARGVVYCHDELERPDGTWEMGKLQYWDTYVRVDRGWCFERRRFLRWYICDALTRPSVGAGIGVDPLSTARLPQSFSELAEFWDTAGSTAP